jgi:hypothetical protein
MLELFLGRFPGFVQTGCTIEVLTIPARYFASSTPFVHPTSFLFGPVAADARGLTSGSMPSFSIQGNRRSRKSSNDVRCSTRQCCPARTSQRYCPSATKPVSRSASFFFSQARISTSCRMLGISSRPGSTSRRRLCICLSLEPEDGFFCETQIRGSSSLS